jgi:hypothetical protein
LEITFPAKLKRALLAHGGGDCALAASIIVAKSVHMHPPQLKTCIHAIDVAGEFLNLEAFDS